MLRFTCVIIMSSKKWNAKTINGEMCHVVMCKLSWDTAPPSSSEADQANQISYPLLNPKCKTGSGRKRNAFSTGDPKNLAVHR